MSLTLDQVYAQARAAGFGQAQAVMAAAIAKAESGLSPTILGDTTITTATWGPSVGLWQVRSLTPDALGQARGADRYRNATRLTDPAYNAKAAYAISGGGQNWRPWSVYTSGAYRQYLAAAKAAGARVEASLRKAAKPVRGDPTVTAQYGQAGPHWASGRHSGVDYGVPAGTPVYAAVAGKVVAEGPGGGAYGTWVKVASGSGWEQIYAHLSSEAVNVGDTVRVGQQLGKSGATGNVTGPHLHYEVRKDGQPVNPATVKTAKLDLPDLPDLFPIPGSGLDLLDRLPGTGKLIPGDPLDPGDLAGAAFGGTVDLVNDKIIKPAWRAAGDLVIKGGVMTFGLLLVALGAHRLSQPSPTVAAAGRIAAAPARAARKGATLAATRGASGAAAKAKPAAPKPPAAKPSAKPAPAAAASYPDKPPF